MKKKALTKFILSLAFILALAAPAAHGEIYTYDETEPIMKGVELRRIRRFFGDTWLNIRCVKADLKEENVGLELLKGGGADILAPVGKLVDTDDRVVAATNADFFDPTYPSKSQGFSLGIEVKDGELLQSQIDENMAAAFYDGGRLAFEYMSMNISVTAPNGESCTVKHLNKHTDYYGDVLMYTSDWNGGLSPAPGGEVLEVVVEDGAVKEFRRGQPPVEIPENGYVLDVSEGVNMFFANNLSPGDSLKLNISASPSLENVTTAFGGGTMLLSGGKKTPYTHTVNGRNPRTCIGTNEDGTVVYIITVDGRQRVSRGATMDELVDIALELGCVNALNLDGGGSTRMIASTFWNSEPHVVNSPTENRKVINAVSIVSTQPDGEAVGVKLRSSADTVLLGDSVNLEYRFYDENEKAVWNNTQEPEWIITGVEGAVENGVFTPYTAGTAEISAKYRDEVCEPLKIKVMSSLGGISLPESINLSVGSTYTLKPEVYDRDGDYAFVENPMLLSPTVSDSNIASVENGVITGLSDGYCVLSVKYEDVYAYMLITVGSPAGPAPVLAENTCYDAMRGTILDSDSFSVFAFDSEPATLLDTLICRRGLDEISASTSYGFLGKFDSALSPRQMRTPIAADSFSAIDKGFALIISLPESGRLSGDNWMAMANALASTKSKNVIVLTKTAPTGQTQSDTDVFYDYMDFISKTKNVFIVQSGERCGSHRRGNVSFLTLADSSLADGLAEKMESASVVRFTMLGDECMYMFDSLFDHYGDASELPTDAGEAQANDNKEDETPQGELSETGF